MLVLVGIGAAYLWRAVPDTERVTLVELVPLLSVAVALAAVIVGPLVSLVIARKQVAATVLSGNRQEWINTLRDELVGVVLAIRNLQTEMRVPRELRLDPESIERLRAIFEAGKRHESKIRLLINPNERDHLALVEQVEQGLAAAASWSQEDGGKPERIAELDGIEEALIETSQVVLKREWKRVKALK